VTIRADETRCGRPGWRIASLMLAAVCLGAAACDRGRPADPIGDASAAPQARSAVPPPPQASVGDQPALPQRGTALVWLSASGVTVLANRAPRFQVLEDLAREAGFGVAIGTGEQPTGSITLRAVEVPLERALARLLEGVPYALHYAANAEGQEASLVRVAFVATDAEEGLSERRKSRGESRRSNEDRALASRERKRELADPARFEEQQWEAIRDLEDERPEVRVDAAESLYPDAAGIDALAAAVTNDSESAVRVAAAESLGYSVEDSAALDALLRALGDPDPKVVVAALEGVEFVGDHTVIPELQFLLEHPDAEVREATVDAIDWLEE
jgi:hypothetical protein